MITLRTQRRIWPRTTVGTITGDALQFDALGIEHAWLGAVKRASFYFAARGLAVDMVKASRECKLAWNEVIITSVAKSSLT